jgi:hypothetical protein
MADAAGVAGASGPAARDGAAARPHKITDVARRARSDISKSPEKFVRYKSADEKNAGCATSDRRHKSIVNAGRVARRQGASLVGARTRVKPAEQEERDAWVILAAAGLFETGWAVGLKYSDGFSRLVPSVATGACMAASFGFLTLALKWLRTGIAVSLRRPIRRAEAPLVVHHARPPHHDARRLQPSEPVRRTGAYIALAGAFASSSCSCAL